MLLCGDSLRHLTPPFPRKEIVDLVDRVIGDTSDDVGEPGFRIDVVEARGFDQRIHDRRPSPAFAGPGLPFSIGSVGMDA